jgi:hypothetical protein
MANICFNTIEFFGDAKVIAKIKNDMTSSSFGEGEGFYSLNFQYSSEDELRITAESRWSPPIKWLEDLSKQYGVVVECEYEEFGNDIWGKLGFRKGKNVFNLEMSYLEGKYNTLSWEEFLDYEVTGLLEDQRPFDEFMEQFDFVSPVHALELEKLFWEYSNED